MQLHYKLEQTMQASIMFESKRKLRLGYHLSCKNCARLQNATVWKQGLKVLIQPAYLARVTLLLAFVVAIFIGHENGDNKGISRAGTIKAWCLNRSLLALTCMNGNEMFIWFSIRGSSSTRLISSTLVEHPTVCCEQGKNLCFLPCSIRST